MVKSTLPSGLKRPMPKPMPKLKPRQPRVPPPPHLLAAKKKRDQDLFDWHFSQLVRMYRERAQMPDLVLSDEEFIALPIEPSENMVIKWTAAKSAARPKVEPERA